MNLLLIAGLTLVTIGLALIVRVILRARSLAKSDKQSDAASANAAFRRLILENGIALGLAFLGMAMLLAAGILG
ncbi:MAG: hypothetical protein AAF844_16315 [Pseudomonadota bacterium]